MIRIEELRLGNIITEQFPIGPLEIVLTKEKMIEVLNNPERFEAILFSGDLLKRLGFSQADEKMPFYKIESSNEISFYLNFFTNGIELVIEGSEEDNSFEIWIGPIVSDFQNLYHSITGEELTIKK